MTKPIKVPFEEAFDPERVRAATNIDPNHLQEEYLAVPGDLGFFCGLYADAIEQHLAAKRALEFGEGELSLHHRASNTGRRITEGEIDALLAGDPEYWRLREDVDAAEVIKKRVGGVIEAIEKKADMLVSLGADVRRERDWAPSINDKERRAGLR
jgi:hypothetical protein